MAPTAFETEKIPSPTQEPVFDNNGKFNISWVLGLNVFICDILLNTAATITDIDDSVATLNNNSENNSSVDSSPDNSDDFVIVSNNIPVDPACGNYERSKPVRVPAPSPHSQTSPTRPSSLPIISEPRPVPTIGSRKMSQPQTPPKVKKN